MLQVTVIHVFEPFTISPVLKVKLDSPSASLSILPIMVLKLFDRRFCSGIRKDWNLAPVTLETETEYRAFASQPSCKRTLEEWKYHFDKVRDDDIEYPKAEEEAYLDQFLPGLCNNEIQVYERLTSFQGKSIPLFIGRVRIVSGPPNVDASVPGILLEDVGGQRLDEVSHDLFSDAIGSAAVAIVIACGDLGVLNYDIRLPNFLVRPDDPKRLVVMVDFADTRLRGEDEDDETWRIAKAEEDEEGAVGYPLQRRKGFDYKWSRQYILTAEE